MPEAQVEAEGRFSGVSGFLRNAALWVDSFPDLWIGDGIAGGMTLLAGGVDAVGDVMDGNFHKVGKSIAQSVAETAAVALPFAEYAGVAGQVLGMETLDVRKWAREWAGGAYDNLTGNFNAAASGTEDAAADPELDPERAPVAAAPAAPKP